ncbi:Polyprotein P1234 [Frankliniella fusca]|uniref:Polyprotein P1234 n=1 Tax=Frankliniella fusca TaxID=407009 RepID=A0AAE1HD11_9NEOP|nr:Polyprotein P1234 [Frankliniella fusca]
MPLKHAQSSRANTMFAKLGMRPPAVPPPKDTKKKQNIIGYASSDSGFSCSYTESERNILNPTFTEKCQSWLQNEHTLPTRFQTPPTLRPALVAYTPSTPSEMSMPDNIKETTELSASTSLHQPVVDKDKENLVPDAAVQRNSRKRLNFESSENDHTPKFNTAEKKNSAVKTIEGNNQGIASKPNLTKISKGKSEQAEGSQRQRRQASQKVVKHDISDSEESDCWWDLELEDPTWRDMSDQSTSEESSSSVTNSPTVSFNKSISNSTKKSSHSFSDNSPPGSVTFSPPRSFNNSPSGFVNNSPPGSVNSSPSKSTAESTPKRKRITKSSAVKERRILRNSGSEYKTAKNKVVAARTMKPLPQCRKKCSTKIDEDNRQKVFSEYWGLCDFDRRVAYISSRVSEMPTKVQRKRIEDSGRKRTCTLKYELEVNNKRVEVCKKCFLATLSENDGFVKRVLLNKKKSVSGVTYLDRRGRKPSSRKTCTETIKAINDHINQYPKYNSHYGRSHTSLLYLGTGLTSRKMYDQYIADGHPKVSFSTYFREFKKTGLKFKPPRIDTCQKCDAFEMSLKCENSIEQLEEIKAERDAHHAKSQQAYDSKKLDKKKMNEQNIVASFDLQQVLYCPHLTCGKVFYKRQLSVYNLTVYDCFNKTGINHMWSEIDAGRGAYEIASCLSKFISSVPAGVQKLTLWSDSCSGQNKNSIICASLISAVASHQSLETIDHKFLVPGHTHMECDRIHAQIEKRKKVTSYELHRPTNFYDFVKTVEYMKKPLRVVEMKNHFLDFASLLKVKSKGPLVMRSKNQDGALFSFSPVQWFRYQKCNPTTILYKHCHDEDAPFMELNLRRKGKLGTDSFNPPQCDRTPRPISMEKKKDLLDLLPQVNHTYHNFYKGIISCADEIDVDPDCVPSEDVADEIDASLAN